MEEQEISTRTLQDWVDREETIAMSKNESDALRTKSVQEIDLRTCRISGIALNMSDLKGITINSLQVIDLLPLLGVIIED